MKNRTSIPIGSYRQRPSGWRWRAPFVLGLFTLCFAALVARAVDLQVLDNGFLAAQGEARFLRTEKISAHRGRITDRNGEPVAISTPVDTIWADPRQLVKVKDKLAVLARALERDHQSLVRQIEKNADREFVYLSRHMRPAQAASVMQLEIPGVHVLREYRRYYPAGEVTAHLVGFTDIDDRGQEGMELAYDHWLAGTDGAKRVLKDRLGQTVRDVESISRPKEGKDLALSIDLRVQYLAYRELLSAIRQHGGRSGSVVVLDIQTGEVLAIANQPSYNPNNRSDAPVSSYRNRAVTDIYEPGSSIKPLVVAAALESGRFEPGTAVDTHPGFVRVGNKTISDRRDYGMTDVTGVVTKSSNVGMTHIALALEPEVLWSTLSRLGLGRLTSSGFPGESAGLLNHYQHWREINQATLSYGYGLTVTTLQLAQAYAAIGSLGIRRPVVMTREQGVAEGERVLSAATASRLIDIMESVTGDEGTGSEARVRGYRVAGKTGTARKSEPGGYSQHRYHAVFAGVAPAEQPRVAIAIMIDEPAGEAYHGGEVAAPVFAAVAAGALRILNVAPDDIAPPALESTNPPITIQARTEP
ncbi:MAG: penicillin-binding protein 2 [Gammaproteobacteria bacterium]|nr:penicillin-binding protein 2 [Gammaproteobacteria bacterium]